MKVLLVILLLGGSIYDGFLSRHSDSAGGGSVTQVKTISQLKAEELEHQRLEREAKIVQVKKITSSGADFNQQASEKYVIEAEKNQLPHWLLPAISFKESTSGRFYPRNTNNLWGYGCDSGLDCWSDGETNLAKFPSIEYGIEYISKKLATGKYYAGKTIEEKVKTYNSINKTYYEELLRVASL